MEIPPVPWTVGQANLPRLRRVSDSADRCTLWCRGAFIEFCVAHAALSPSWSTPPSF